MSPLDAAPSSTLAGGHARLVASPRHPVAGLEVEVTAPELWEAWEELRRLSSLPAVAATGATHGYRVEDLVEVSVVLPEAPPGPSSIATTEAWLRRRVPAACAVQATPAPHDEGGVFLRARFAARGASGLTQRQAYARDADGKIRLEAFELHATEHCNLRCEACCNMSPYLPEATLSAAEIGATCREMARFVTADVFKIMGGEPLLHPDITGVLEAVRASGVSPLVRLFTNGLLLHKMDDDFWRVLDELTVSVYSSAPVKPAHLALIREKARRFDVVLNVKPVDAFSEVMTAERQDDPAALARTYQQCWLRHRCMVVRRGVFYTCTRAAYQEDFSTRILHQPPERAAADDGVPLGGDDFGERLLAYLNRGRPLGACTHCRGSDGASAGHAQLTKADVREGRLRRRTNEPSAERAAPGDEA